MEHREFYLEQSYEEFLDLLRIYAKPCGWGGLPEPGTLFYVEMAAYSLRIGCKGHDNIVYCCDFWITPLREGGIRVSTTLPEILPPVKERKRRMFPHGLLTTVFFLIWLIPLWLLLDVFGLPGGFLVGIFLFAVVRTDCLSKKERDNQDCEIKWRKLLIEDLKLPVREAEQE